MIYYVYDIFEKDYHFLEKSTCDCLPSVRIVKETGDLLIIHGSLVDPSYEIPEEIINNAIKIIVEDLI